MDSISVLSYKDAKLYSGTEKLIKQNAQHETFHEEIKALQENRVISKCCTLKLNSVMNCDSILYAGCRLSNAKLNIIDKNPLVFHIVDPPLPSTCQTIRSTVTICLHLDNWMKKRLISSKIYYCVTCRKIKRKPEHQGYDRFTHR